MAGAGRELHQVGTAAQAEEDVEAMRREEGNALRRATPVRLEADVDPGDARAVRGFTKLDRDQLVVIGGEPAPVSSLVGVIEQVTRGRPAARDRRAAIPA